ncbi:MAG: hypothetical protein NTV34_22040 [Proteobacteria bacterium]|nr:hypothetical protein [Pseudomonadota bacterium]
MTQRSGGAKLVAEATDRYDLKIAPAGSGANCEQEKFQMELDCNGDATEFVI